MIRILQIIDSMDLGGAQVFIMNIYRNIDREKVQFDFLVHTDKECAYYDEIKSLGGKIYSVPPRNQGIFKNRKALNEFFKRHPEYKIVHQHVSSLTYVEPLKCAKRNDVPVRIVHSHSTRQGGSFLHKYIHYWNQLFLKSYATHYFACSDLAAKWLYGEKMYNEGQVTIINNGIEIDKFIFNELKRKEIRKKLGIQGKFVLGHVGRFAYPKNHDFLIDIFKAVHDKEPKSVLILVGDGELKSKIEKKSESLGLKDSIIFTGVRSDIPDLLQAMDVFVFPSHYEGLPVTLVEAQASGLPCIVSNKITKEIKLTDLVEFISLDADINNWKDLIISKYKDDDRIKYNNIIKKSDFDIYESCKVLEEVYMK